MSDAYIITVTRKVLAMRIKIAFLRYRIISALYLFAVYAFGILTKSAWSDDYPTLLDPNGMALHAVRDSRLIYGAFSSLLFGEFDSIAALVFIRLIGFIGLVFLSDLILRHLLRIRPSLHIVAAVIIAFTLPSFQFSSHWATAFMMSWSAYFAILGFHLQESSKKLCKLLAGLSLMFSLLFYPLWSFFLFAYIYSHWLVRNTGFKVLFKEIAKTIFFLTACGGVSYLVAYFYLHFFTLTFNPRVEILGIAAIPEKLVFFFSRPVALTYRPYFIDSPTMLGYLSTIGIFVFILLILFWLNYQNFLSVFKHFMVFNMSVVLTLLPLLLVSDNQIDLRFIASNTWLYMFVVIFLLTRLLKYDDIRINEFFRKSVTPIIGSLLVIGFVSTNYNFVTLYKKPYLEKRSFISQQITECSQAEIRHQIIIVRRSIPWEEKNNIGAYSQRTDLASEWVPVGAVYYYLKDIGLTPNTIPLLSQEETGESSCYISLDNYPKR